MSLSDLSPFGPIFRKELRVAARRKRNYVLRVAYLGGLLLFLLLAWAVTRESFGAGAAARAQQQAQLGWMFFMFFSMFCVVAMGLIGPVLTSTAIGSERLAKSLHVLLLTPVTSWQIVAGKLFSRLLMALTLIGLSLPVLALVRLLGGVELGQMFGVVCLAAVTALSSAAIGLLLSVFMNRAYAVILLSYAAMLILYAFIPFVVGVYVVNARASWRMQLPWLELLSTSNPIFCTGVLASGQFRMLAGAGWLPGWLPAWSACAIAHVAFTGVLLVLSAVALRRVSRREGEGAAPAPSPEAPGDEAGAGDGDARRSPTEPWVPNPNLPIPDVARQVADAPPPRLRQPPRRRRPERTVSDHPVLWRETHRPLMPKRWQRVVGSIACVALLLLTYVSLADGNDLDEPEVQIGYAFVFNALAMLLTGVIAATTIAQEKEGDSWTLLLATPLDGESVVWGKALGTLRRLLAPFVLVALHFVGFTLAGVLRPGATLLILWVIVTFNLPWIATGVYLSLRLAKVTLAVILNLMIPVVLYGVVPLLLVVAHELLGIRGDDLVEQVCWYLPYYYLGPALEELVRNREIWVPETWVGGSSRVSAGTFLAIAFVAGLAHVALAAGLLHLTAMRFDRIVCRAEQVFPLPYQMPRQGFGTPAAGGGA